MHKEDTRKNAIYKGWSSTRKRNINDWDIKHTVLTLVYQQNYIKDILIQDTRYKMDQERDIWEKTSYKWDHNIANFY